jgi:spore coat polysaccharide biosynthesis protein SpsF
MNVIAIVQARTGSTRLPGKILKKINNKVVLDYVIERIQQCSKIDDIVLATTTSEKDDVLEKYAKNKVITLFRGSEEDVLSRYYKAAEKYKADQVVRITSDCPLIDPKIIDKIIDSHIANKADYTSNTLNRTYPRGLDVEAISFKTLEEAYKNSNKEYQREHVTPYIIEHPEKFKLQNIESVGKIRRPDIRITLDTPEDLKLIKKILLHFNNLDFTTEEIIEFLNRNPKLLDINKNIKQKGVENS